MNYGVNFPFDERIKPEQPLDTNDPPPEGWNQLDNRDFRSRLFGSGNSTMRNCADWELRELARIEQKELQQTIMQTK